MMMRKNILIFLLVRTSFLYETTVNTSEVADISDEMLMGQELIEAEKTIYFK